MIKKLYLLLLLLACTCSAVLAQVSASDLAQLHQVAHFKDGEDKLLRHLAKNIRYPVTALRANKTGAVVGVIKIARNGDIVAVGTLNKAEPMLKAEFERVAKATKGKWVATNDTAAHFYVILPIHFNIEGQGYVLNSEQRPDFFQAVVEVRATAVPRNNMAAAEWQGSIPYQATENELVAQVNAFVQEEKYSDAIRKLEELINLQPLHLAYYQPLVTLYERTENEKEAAYYREVVQLFTK